MGSIILLLLHIACFVMTGMWAWDFIHPHSFWGFLGFLIVWGIAEKVATMVLAIASAALLGKH